MAGRKTCPFQCISKHYTYLLEIQFRCSDSSLLAAETVTGRSRDPSSSVQISTVCPSYKVNSDFSSPIYTSVIINRKYISVQCMHMALHNVLHVCSLVFCVYSEIFYNESLVYFISYTSILCMQYREVGLGLTVIVQYEHRCI